jgi:hypothetical protein
VKYSEQDCLSSLEQAYNEVDGEITQVSYREWRGRNDPAVRTIQRKCGGWNEAKNKAQAGKVLRQGENDKSPSVEFVSPTGSNQVYTQIRHMYKGERWFVLIHRLIAVAKYGFDDVCDNVVHHKSGFGLDNRHENIGLLERAEHSSEHIKNRERVETGELK